MTRREANDEMEPVGGVNQDTRMNQEVVYSRRKGHPVGGL